MSCRSLPSIIGSFVGVLLSETTRLKLKLPNDLLSGANVSLPNPAVLPSKNSPPVFVL